MTLTAGTVRSLVDGSRVEDRGAPDGAAAGSWWLVAGGAYGAVGNGIGIGIWRFLSSLALLIHREEISLNIENEICKMKTSG